MRNEYALVAVAAALLAMVGSVAADETGAPDRETVGKVAVPGASALCPARLTPDGSAVVYIRRQEQGAPWSYWHVGADGADAKKVFDSPVRWDDMFSGAFGHGMFSPDGSKMLVLTTDNGKSVREGGNPRMAIVPVASESGENGSIVLPSEKGAVFSAVFADDETVYYADNSPRDAEQPTCVLRRFDVAAKKATTVVGLGPGMCAGLTVSPDGQRIGASLFRLVDGRPTTHLWVFDVQKGAWQGSSAWRLDDYFYDGMPFTFWSADGRHLVANGKAIDPDLPRTPKSPFSILMYTPDEDGFADQVGKGKVEVLQKDQDLATTYADSGGVIWATKDRAVYRVDTGTNQAEKRQTSLLPLQRQGGRLLCTDLERNRLMVGPVSMLEGVRVDPGILTPERPPTGCGEAGAISIAPPAPRP